MGFHICQWCGDLNTDRSNRFSHLSSGDVTLYFRSGNKWQMPDMILHYVADHGWVPPLEFIDDVMNSEYAGGERIQYRSMTFPVRIGYLTEDFVPGEVPEGFVEKLLYLMSSAANDGHRLQTKGM